MPASDTLLALHVLQELDLDPTGLHVESLKRHSGFSGARVWQCVLPAARLCLRAWPVGTDGPRLTWVHRLMRTARADGLSFVPEILRTRASQTYQVHEQRLWDVTTWMPGQACAGGRSPLPQLRAGCEGLARVHQSWARVEGGLGPCPAIQRRLTTWGRWQELLAKGWHPSLAPLFRRAWNLLDIWMPRVPGWLEPFRLSVLPMQPCLCDVWQEHLLFREDRVTGLIDYGEAKMDHVAVDLARFLGSATGDDDTAWAGGLEAYRRVRPLSGAEETLAHVLDQSGTVLGMSNWLRWLFHDGRRFENPAAVEGRLVALVERVERWEPGLIR